MNVMDVEAGSHIFVDGMGWILLDYFTDSALCLLDGMLPSRVFGATTWENSYVRKFLNEQFSLKLQTGNIRNTPHDSKVFLLSQGMFDLYKDMISEAPCNWWLMPEGGNPLVVTNANLVVSVGKKAAAGVRPVVRYARNTECEVVGANPPLIQPGQSLCVGNAKLTFLERGHTGSTFLCIYKEPVGWKWDDRKGEDENFASLEQFILWDLKCVPVKREWQEPAFNGDKTAPRVGRVSLLTLTQYRTWKEIVPPWEGEWMLSTKVAGEKGAGFLSVNGQGIGVTKKAAVRPVVILSEEVVYGNRNWG